MIDVARTMSCDRRKGWRVNERKEISRMARRRYQNGCLFKRGKNWVLRYREDMLNPDGSVRRAHRSIVLGPLETKKEARRMAGTYLAQFNDGTRRAETAITLEDFWHGYFATEI